MHLAFLQLKHFESCLADATVVACMIYDKPLQMRQAFRYTQLCSRESFEDASISKERQCH